MPLTPKQAHWQSVIEEWQHSGLTQKTFCQQRDINLHAFGYWIKKFRVASHDATSSDHSSAAFMCLDVRARLEFVHTDHRDSASLTHAQNASCILGGRFNPAQVRRMDYREEPGFTCWLSS